jgi:hypothetical protein
MMSATTTAPAPTPAAQTAQTNAAISAAETGAALLNNLQTADPALYQQLVGSFSTYGKSAAAPLVGSLLGLLVAHYGLASYVTPDTLNLLTDALVALGTGAGALVMHWIGKRPGNKLAGAVPGAKVGTP